MAIVRPFAALRPEKQYAEKVISLPYDVMSRDEARKLAGDNPFSFLRISRSEIDLPHIEDPYDPAVYLKAKSNLDDFISRGILVREEKPNFYIYRQTMNGRVQTGITACVSVDEYLNGIIKKHEFTRVEKELDRINNFDLCNANTEPVFLTYRHDKQLDDIIELWVEDHAPEYDFVTTDSIGHALWAVDGEKTILSIEEIFKRIPALYIADGHHRSASAAKVGLKRREENPGYTGIEEFNYFMAVLFPDADLQIFDYNRVIKDLNGLDETEFLKELSLAFEIEKIPEGSYRPERKHIFSMYLKGCWYKLTAKESIVSDHVIKGLDVSILQDHVLEPLLGIHDPRTDRRIDFVGGIRGLGELKRRVDDNMAVAFALYPASMEDLLTVADENEIMPPKSTWFEPKLGSGLFIHML